MCVLKLLVFEPSKIDIENQTCHFSNHCRISLDSLILISTQFKLKSLRNSICLSTSSWPSESSIGNQKRTVSSKPCPLKRSLWRSFVNVVIPICYKGSTRRSIYSHLDRMVVNFGMVGKRTSNCGTRLKSLVAKYHIFLMIFHNAK